MPAVAHRFQQVLDFAGEERDPTLGFASPYLVACTLPHSAQDTNVYVRNTPWAQLKIVSDPEFGVPYGVAPRLLMHRLTTLAVQRREREITLAPTLSEAAREIGLGDDFRALQRFRAQLNSTFRSTWYVQVDDRERDTQRVYSFRIATTGSFGTDAGNPDELWNPTFLLSEEYLQMLLDRGAVPYDFGALTKMLRSPLGMDLYVFLATRAPQVQQPTFIAYWWLMSQFGTSFSNDKNGRKDFSRAVRRELVLVKQLYPALKVDPTTRRISGAGGREGGLMIEPSPPCVPPRRSLHLVP